MYVYIDSVLLKVIITGTVIADELNHTWPAAEALHTHVHTECLCYS